MNGFDLSPFALIDGATINQDSKEAISTADIALFSYFGQSRYDHAQYDHADFEYSWTVQEWNEIVLWDQDTTQLLFAGYVLSIEQSQMGPHIRMQLHCSDWGIILERTLITQTWPDGTPDSTIIEDLLKQVPSLKAGVITTMFANLGQIEVKDQRIRDVLDMVCTLTGGEWNVSYDGKLNYYREGSIVAPFGFSDAPNGSTLMPYQPDNIGNDFSDAANRVTVLGAVDGAREVRYTAEDRSSQQTYGILSITLVDRSLSDQDTAQVWAQTEVATRARPKPTVTLSYFAPGLTRGMSVYVEAGKYGLFATMILRSLTLVIMAPDRDREPVPGHKLKYTASLGSRPPDLVYSLRRMQRRPEQPTIQPAAVIPPGSITGGDFAEGIAPVYIVDHKPVSGEWDQYPADAVFFYTVDRKLYRRTGNDWTAVVDTADIEGQLQTHQFAPGSVTTTVLADGSVVTAKIPAGAIQAPQIAIGAVTPSAIADGAVTTAKIPAGAITGPQLAASSVTANAIAANAIAANNIQAGAVIAGKIAANAVSAGNIESNTIAANHVQAGAITATALAAGSVTANAVAANAIYSEALQANSIKSIHLVANAVVAGKIAALAVVAGNIAADAVTAGTIAVAAVRAGNIAAGAVRAGNIEAGAVTADSIQTGSITSDKFSTIEIAVGYGGFKPGRVAVYAGEGLVGLLGDMGGAGLPANTYFGIWAKMFGFGGTNYSNAPLYSNAAGAVFIRNVSLSISDTTVGSSIITSPGTFDSTYQSIMFRVQRPGDSTTDLISRGMVIRRSSDPNTTCGAFVRAPSDGRTSELSIYGTDGVINILLNGITGTVRGAQFQAGGSPGVTRSVTISGTTLNFVGGLFVG